MADEKDVDPRSEVSIGEISAWLAVERATVEITRVQTMHRLVLFRPGVPAGITHHDDAQAALLALAGHVLKSRHSMETDDGRMAIEDGG